MDDMKGCSPQMRTLGTPEFDGKRESFEDFCGQPAMQKALYSIGLTPDLAASKLQEELEATVTRATLGKDNDYVYSDPMVAWEIRQRARQDLTRYWGGLTTTEDRSQVVVEIRDANSGTKIVDPEE